MIEVPAQVRKAEARLMDETNADALPADDRGYAVSTVGEGTNVRLISPGNRFLKPRSGCCPASKPRWCPLAQPASPKPLRRCR